MSYTNGLDKPDEYFNTKLYTGNGSTQSITGINFQPDMVWTKIRNGVYDHNIFDVVRGVTKDIRPNTTNAEGTQSGGLTSFDSDGYSLGSWIPVNESSSTYVSWNWLANGAGSSNTDGSISATVSVNTTSGFSIVKYTGNATGGATIGHGLGVKPAMILMKNLNQAYDWVVYHQNIGATKYLILNATNAETTGTGFLNNTEPTSSVITLGSGGSANGSSDNLIAYCFAEKKGFSKFGSYTGNGNASDGTFVYLGFRPAFVIIKRTDTSGYNWVMVDNKRSPYNLVQAELYPSSSTAEDTAAPFADFVSNGFKMRTASNSKNASGGTYIYMAFAEFPIVSSSGTPCTAR